MLKPNIRATGRILRALAGLGCSVAAAVCWHLSALLALGLTIAVRVPIFRSGTWLVRHAGLRSSHAVLKPRLQVWSAAMSRSKNGI